MIKIILIFTILFTSAFSIEKYRFIGLNLSAVNTTFNTGESETDAVIGIVAGIQSHEWRLKGLIYFDFSGYSEFSVETDKLFKRIDFEDFKMKPYVGISVGYFNHENMETDKSIFGLHGGAIINLTDDYDIDISISHKVGRDSSSLDSMNSLSVNLNYFF